MKSKKAIAITAMIIGCLAGSIMLTGCGLGFWHNAEDTAYDETITEEAADETGTPEANETPDMTIDEVNSRLIGVWLPADGSTDAKAYHFGYVENGMSATGEVFGISSEYISEDSSGGHYGGICPADCYMDGTTAFYIGIGNSPYAAGAEVGDVTVDVSNLAENQVTIGGLLYEKHSDDPTVRDYLY